MPIYSTDEPGWDLHAYGLTDFVERDVSSSRYVSLYPWSNKAMLRRLKVTAETVNVPHEHKMFIRILSHPAKFRADYEEYAPPTDPSLYVDEERYSCAAWAVCSIGPPSSNWQWDEAINDAYSIICYDYTRCNKLHIMIETGAFTDTAPDAQFRVEAWGQTMRDDTQVYGIGSQFHDRVYYIKDDTAKRFTSVASYVEANSLLRETGKELNLFPSLDHYLYVGSFKPFNNVHFDVIEFDKYGTQRNNRSPNAVPLRMDVQHLTPSGWQNAPEILDCTNNPNKDTTSGSVSLVNYTCAWPGVVQFEKHPNWRKLLIDPSEFNVEPDTQLRANPRYWARFRLVGPSLPPNGPFLFYSAQINPDITADKTMVPWSP